MAGLRQCFIHTWNSLSQSIVDDAIDEWQKDLRPVNEKGGHFEQLLSNGTWIRTGYADKVDVVVQL